MIRLFYILMLLFLVECNIADNYISDGYYNTIVNEVPLDSIKFDDRVPFTINTEFKVGNEPFTKDKVTYMFSTNPRSLYFKSDSLEIRFQVKNDNYKFLNSKLCHISIKRIKDKALAFVIIWQNHNDKMGRIIDDEIGVRTDTLYSTLSYSMIKGLYPDYNGYYQHIVIDTIYLNPNIELFNPIDPGNYYENIEFKGLKKSNNKGIIH